MIKEVIIYHVPIMPKSKSDWERCAELEQEHGEVTIQLLMREFYVRYEKARKILNRYEGMKLAKEIQGRWGNREE